MFRPMRRHRQQLSQGTAPPSCPGDLRRPGRGRRRRLPLCGPPSAMYQEGTLFFHCAKAGHKLDALRRCSKASLLRYRSGSGGPPEYTTYFRSVIAFGRTRIFGGRGGETSCHLAPGGEILPRRQPGASPGGHSPGGRRTVPCVALHRAHDRQAGHRAGSGRPPAG